VRLELEGARGESSTVEAASVGGGSVAVSRVDGFDTELHGDAWVTLAETPGNLREAARKILSPHGKLNFVHNGEKSLAILQSGDEPTKKTLAALASNGVAARVIRPVFFPVKGAPLWNSAESLENYASANSLSIAESCAEYEQALLGMTRGEVMAEMKRRYSIMKASCESALAGRLEMPMQLLRPTADKIFAAASSGKSKFSGPHAKAAARAMAIMHANGGMNVVVAAPTGGAAGALPAVIITLEEHLGLSEDEACMALFAAAAVGVIVDSRTTFAAEVAGCQVEIGAGAAMASAACAYACGGTAKEALDAAAISFQNTMGLVCDPVQGMVEIPCHTRNAVYAASAFVNADIATGGYENPLPLDETIDAVFATGLMRPPELRCTSMGGLSLCPSGLAMPRLR
jgi:L-serine dehydratase